MTAAGQLAFYHGPMGAGKSTFALQTHFNRTQQGRRGVLLTTSDRSGEPKVTSRIGLRADAVIVDAAHDLGALLAGCHGDTGLDHVVCDEAQFLTPEQVEELAEVVDTTGIDAFTFGLLTDFQTRLFPGSARLVELADDVIRMQAAVLCWCGRTAVHNARVSEGRMIRAGERVAIGDTDGGSVQYRPLCRAHHREGRLCR